MSHNSSLIIYCMSLSEECSLCHYTQCIGWILLSCPFLCVTHAGPISTSRESSEGNFQYRMHPCLSAFPSAGFLARSLMGLTSLHAGPEWSKKVQFSSMYLCTPCTPFTVAELLLEQYEPHEQRRPERSEPGRANHAARFTNVTKLRVPTHLKVQGPGSTVSHTHGPGSTVSHTPTTPTRQPVIQPLF